MQVLADPTTAAGCMLVVVVIAELLLIPGRLFSCPAADDGALLLLHVLLLPCSMSHLLQRGHVRWTPRGTGAPS
jgi:hypothetical protein